MKIDKFYRKMNFFQLFNAKFTCYIDFTKNHDIIIMGEDENAVFCVRHGAQNSRFHACKIV